MFSSRAWKPSNYCNVSSWRNTLIKLTHYDETKKRTHDGSRVDVISRYLPRRSSWISKQNNLTILNLCVTMVPHIQFYPNLTYGSGDDENAKSERLMVGRQRTIL